MRSPVWQNTRVRDVECTYMMGTNNSSKFRCIASTSERHLYHLGHREIEKTDWDADKEKKIEVDELELDRKQLEVDTEADREKLEEDTKKYKADRKKLGADTKKLEADRKKLQADMKEFEAGMKKLEGDRKKLEEDKKTFEVDKKKLEADQKKLDKDILDFNSYTRHKTKKIDEEWRNLDGEFNRLYRKDKQLESMRRKEESRIRYLKEAEKIEADKRQKMEDEHIARTMK